MKMVVLKCTLLCLLAATTPWLKFFGDWYERWMENGTVAFVMPAPVATYFAFVSFVGVVTTLLAFFNTSVADLQKNRKADESKI